MKTRKTKGNRRRDCCTKRKNGRKTKAKKGTAVTKASKKLEKKKIREGGNWHACNGPGKKRGGCKELVDRSTGSHMCPDCKTIMKTAKISKWDLGPLPTHFEEKDPALY